MTTHNKFQTSGDFLAWATAELTEVNIPTARLDSLILLEDTTGMDRAHLLAHPDLRLKQSQRLYLERLLQKRKKHIPIAYLRNEVMFYGRTFYVNQHTLIPRPESEEIITLLKKCYDNNSQIRIADIGTGSGCLGLTAAMELENSSIDLYDIDPRALEVSKKNAHKLGLTAHYFKEDLLSQASSRRYDVILANLPYVPDDYEINIDATFEPKEALFAGVDGLEDYRLFWQQLKMFKSPPNYVITESLPDQHKELIELAKNARYKLQETHDFVQLFIFD